MKMDSHFRGNDKFYGNDKKKSFFVIPPFNPIPIGSSLARTLSIMPRVVAGRDGGPIFGRNGNRNNSGYNSSPVGLSSPVPKVQTTSPSYASNRMPVPSPDSDLLDDDDLAGGGGAGAPDLSLAGGGGGGAVGCGSGTSNLDSDYLRPFSFREVQEQINGFNRYEDMNKVSINDDKCVQGSCLASEFLELGREEAMQYFKELTLNEQESLINALRDLGDKTHNDIIKKLTNVLKTDKENELLIEEVINSDVEGDKKQARILELLDHQDKKKKQ
jgi:hypothetical protein